MKNDNTFLNANFISPVDDEDGATLKVNEVQTSNLVADILSKYETAKSAKMVKERAWLDCYRNYRGVYGKNVRFRDSEKSRVFVKITKTKVLAAYGMLIDVAFGTDKFPIGVSETKVPEGVSTHAYLKQPESEQAVEEAPKPEVVKNPFDVGYKGDEELMNPGDTHQGNLGGISGSYEGPSGVVLTSDLPVDPQAPAINPAKEAALRLERLIHDQIEESNGENEVRSALFEACLLGTGIIKGPFNYNKKLHRWEEDEDGNREYKPIDVRVPRIQFVSCWDFYPDVNATTIEECSWTIERHRLNKSQLRNLRNLPYFNEEALIECLNDAPNYIAESFETQLSLNENTQQADPHADRYEVVEYWGTMDAMSAKEVGLKLPSSVSDLDEIQINAWICGNKLLRIVVNPFTPARIPYHAFAYEKNPYNFFGIGVAENMDDSQQIMNGHARMAIDNLALSGSLMFDIDESALTPGQDMKMYPGKIFRRQAGMPGQAIYPLKFPNTSNENLMMFDKFRQLADEQTGIPSYSHGQTGIQSTTRTASGMSMLMGAASLNIKTVIKNLDDYLLKPLGEAYFWWNNQFYEGKLGVIGDLEVVAKGTSSIMQKEVRSQRLTMFLQTASNPAIAPYIKMSTLVKEFARSIDLDPQELLNTPEEAAIHAAIVGMQNANQNGGEAGASGQAPDVGGVPQVPAGTQNPDPTGTGNGNIAPANVQAPGTESFSG